MKTIEHFIDQQAAAEQEFMESFHPGTPFF